VVPADAAQRLVACLRFRFRGTSSGTGYSSSQAPYPGAFHSAQRLQCVRRSPFQGAREQFLAEGKGSDHEPVAIHMLTKPNLTDSASDNAALLALIEKLTPQGAVVVTDYREGYQIVDYLRRYTAAPIRLIFWMSDILRIMEEKWLQSEPGAVLEGLGRLLLTDVTIYAVPMSMEAFVAALGTMPEVAAQPADGDLITLDHFLPKPPMEHLLRYLRAAERVVPLKATQAVRSGSTH